LNARYFDDILRNGGLGSVKGLMGRLWGKWGLMLRDAYRDGE
jgi:hypothetical protein